MPDPSMGSYPAYPWFRRAVLGIAAFLFLLTFQVFLLNPTHRYLVRQAEELEGKVQFLQSVQDTLIPEFQRKLKSLSKTAPKAQAARLAAKIDSLGHQVTDMRALADEAKRKRTLADEGRPTLTAVQLLLAFLALWVLFCLSKILLTPFHTEGMDDRLKRQKPIRFVRAGAWTVFPLIVLLSMAWSLFTGAPVHDEWIENLGAMALGTVLAFGVWVYSLRIRHRVEMSFGSDFWRFKETPLGRVVQALWKSLLEVPLTFLSSHSYSSQDGRLRFEPRRAGRYVLWVFLWTAVVYSLGGLALAQWADRADAPRGAWPGALLLLALVVLSLKVFRPQLLAWPGRRKVTCPLCGQESATFLNRLCGTCGAFLSRWGEKLETPFELKGPDQSRVMGVGLCLGVLAVTAGLLAADADWRILQGLVDRSIQSRMAQSGFYEPIRLHLPPAGKFRFCLSRKDLAWASLVQASVDAKNFRRKHGRWPDAAWEMEQESGKSNLYGDPYTRGRLKFLRTNREVVIYSLGPDRLDDQGAPFDPKTGRGDLLVRLRDEYKK